MYYKTLSLIPLYLHNHIHLVLHCNTLHIVYLYIAFQQFLNKYLEEQREEEDKMCERLMRLKLAGDNTSAILLLDHEQVNQ